GRSGASAPGGSTPRAPSTRTSPPSGEPRGGLRPRRDSRRRRSRRSTGSPTAPPTTGGSSTTPPISTQ
ncbi:hypothetical protein, partial [Methanoculleus chikugoensis]|uniref:hypothetical protein n=1 Tax=Methanoculleus chikugoensis TaxID=118126 RepID=UPI001FB56176